MMTGPSTRSTHTAAQTRDTNHLASAERTPPVTRNIARITDLIRAQTTAPPGETVTLLTTPQLALARGMRAAIVRRLARSGSRPDCQTLALRPLWHEDRDPHSPRPHVQGTDHRLIAVTARQLASMMGTSPATLDHLLDAGHIWPDVVIRSGSGETPGWLTSAAWRRYVLSLKYCSH